MARTQLRGSQIADETINADDIQDNSVRGSADNTIGATPGEIAQGTVSSIDLRDGAITAASLSAEVLALISSSGGGIEYYSSTDDTVSITTSTAPQDKLSLVLTGLALGTYRLGWSYNWNYNNITNDFIAEIQDELATVLGEHRQEPKDAAGSFDSTGTNQKYQASGFTILSLSGDKTFTVKWGSSSAGKNASIWNVKLELLRV